MRLRSLGLSMAVAVLLLAAGLSSASADGEDVYFVQPGDALLNIARRFGTTADALVRLNGLPSADRIKIGQALRVPIPAGTAPQSAASAAGPSTDTGNVHVVSPGENLASIARRYGVTVDDLVAASQLANRDFLQVGQRLTVPAGREGTARTSARESTRKSPSLGPLESDEWSASYLRVSYRSQFDGSTWGDSNCGPAALAMAMSYYGEWWSSDGIRRDVNGYTGDWSTDGGSDWGSLVRAARKRGFQIIGLMQGDDYRRWTLDDLMEQVSQGQPPVLLVRFRYLPGQGSTGWYGDHYIVFLGLTPDGRVVYHDSAFYDEGAGAYSTMTQQQLMRAWGNNYAGIQYSAMALKW